MPVGIVAEAAFAEPDRLRDPEFVGKDPFVIRALESGVSHLHIREQPFLGHEHRAAPVRLDAAPFEYDASFLVRPQRLATRKCRMLSDHRADLPVLREVLVLGPRVEIPIHQLHTAVGEVHAGGGRIAQPDAVARAEVQMESRLAHLVHLQRVPRLFLGCLVVAEDVHVLVLGDHARDLRVHPGDRTELPGPIGFVMRPRDPRRIVPFPLGGPAPCHAPSQRLRIGAYASTRRSRRKGQLRRVPSINAGSHLASSVASPVSACAR